MSERTFTLHLCCANCLRPTARDVVVPQTDDAPYDVESFLESALMARLKFSCSQCESCIGALVAVTTDEDVCEHHTDDEQAA